MDSTIHIIGGTIVPMRFLLFIVIVFAFVGGFFFLRSDKKSTKEPVQKAAVQSIEAEKESPVEGYIFVPYWTIDSDLSSSPYDIIYFGISATKNGIDYEDQGYKNLDSFSKVRGEKKSFLAVRMLDSDVNLAVLKDKNLQENIANEAIQIARSNNFSGIILDLEIQGLPFESFIKSITSFNALFSKRSHEQNISFAALLYGDVFYRIRPYDVGQISKETDRVFVMAYDFSKAKGDPGPNFPLEGKDTYGYDFKTMTSDFLKEVPKNKLTIIFGMFGYDWTVDEKSQTKGTASSKSTFGFEKFVTQCTDSDSCTITNSDMYGTKITYQKDGEKHVIFFENNRSVEKKKEFLYSKGLKSFSYWAYSFF